MKIKFAGQYSMNPKMLIRRCGYGAVFGREPSFARRLSGGEYPRLHVYLDEEVGGFTVNLHLDQKKPSYGAHTAHSGEYDGEVVEREGARIKAMVESLSVKS